MAVDPHLPLLDGICFDDTLGLPPAFVTALAGRGLLWGPALRHGGRRYAGVIVAQSMERDRGWQNNLG